MRVRKPRVDEYTLAPLGQQPGSPPQYADLLGDVRLTKAKGGLEGTNAGRFPAEDLGDL